MNDVSTLLAIVTLVQGAVVAAIGGLWRVFSARLERLERQLDEATQRSIRNESRVTALDEKFETMRRDFLAAIDRIERGPVGRPG